MEPAKNSTLATLPLLSAALAERVMVAGAAKLLPLTGAVKLTVGRMFAAMTVTLIGSDLLDAPELSVTTAVIE